MSDDLVKRLLETEKHIDLEGEAYELPINRDGREAAARIAQLEAERDEALRRRDAWKARAENHVQIVDALRAKTAGQDSRTLSRALLGAAKLEAEARADAAEAKLREAVEALRAFHDFDAIPWQAKRQDIFERRVRLPILAAYARLTGEAQDGGDDE